MPKIVCTNCQTEYKIAKSGAVVVEMFNNPPRPYKIWNADGYECPGCGNRIIAGFGAYPNAEHYQDGFVEFLEKIKASPIAQSGWLIYDFEKPQPE